jgi:hypothetical protein
MHQQRVLTGLLLSHIIRSLLNFFYFITCLGNVILNFNRGKVISPFYNFIWRTVYTLHFRGLDNFSSHLDYKLMFKSVESP